MHPKECACTEIFKHTDSNNIFYIVCTNKFVPLSYSVWEELMSIGALMFEIYNWYQGETIN